MVRSKKSSEFGGVPGRIAPAPHRVEDVAYEQARLNVQTNPDDVTDPLAQPAGVLAAERELEGRGGEVAS